MYMQIAYDIYMNILYKCIIIIILHVTYTCETGVHLYCSDECTRVISLAFI